MRILIVEDDCLLAEAVSDYFSAKGWQTEEAHDGNSALEMAASGNWQMILLDVMLPGMDGFSVCREIRRSSDVPVFFITARVLEADELNGYAVGADDYVTKPFSLPVLYAKVMAMMGRIRGGRPEERVRRGDVEVEAGTRKVYVQGKERFLPPKEFEMLLFFLEIQTGLLQENSCSSVSGDMTLTEMREWWTIISKSCARRWQEASA